MVLGYFQTENIPLVGLEIDLHLTKKKKKKEYRSIALILNGRLYRNSS